MKLLNRAIYYRAMIVLAASTALLSASFAAAAPRILPQGTTPNDSRLGELRTLRASYFPFHPPTTKKQWDQRVEQLRRRILVTTGLWPMPEKTPLNPVIHGRVQREGFTVEKVYFQSYPGHYVTGLLFRPVGKSGRLPAVLSPHGHGGRLQDHGPQRIRQYIVKGEERFEGSGRYPKLARCAQLARMGCVTFIFDMVGYADSQQISRAIAHGFAKQRSEFDKPQSWGFFSTQAELRFQSIMGLQTYNSIRALDFLSQLPDVDSNRIGVTGGSGGGTQTILLGAIDPRPVVSFPQGMVSTAMQGGCTCENCSLLRVDTGNVELAGLFAPRPLAMTGANDWTKEIATKGYPELQQLYSLLGVKENVYSVSQLHFPHNYNYVTRAIMYRWFNKHLKLGLNEPIVEEDFPPLTKKEWTVWDKNHPAPEGGAQHERALTAWIDRDANKQLAALTPKDASSLAEYRRVVGGAIDIVVGRPLPASSEVKRKKIKKYDRGSYFEFHDLLQHNKYGHELPLISLFPKSEPWNGLAVIWVDGRGKAAMYDESGAPRKEIMRLLNAGTAVLGADLLYQGEFLTEGRPVTQNRVVKNPREFAGFTYGYNHPLFAQRVHDILSLVAFAVSDDHGPADVSIVGTGGAGPWVAAARAQAGGVVKRAVIDTEGFRFRELTSYRDENFLNGAVKYGDLPGLLSLSAPYPLWIAGEDGKVPEVVAASYQAAGAGDKVVSYAGKPSTTLSAAIDWLLRIKRK